MLKKIVIVLVAVLVVFAIIAAMQPDEFRVERSMLIGAAPEAVFPLVNTSRSWEQWSPWAKIDPNAKFSYEGAEAGEGAVTRWDGNMEVGAGSSTVMVSRPNELIEMKLEFLKPMKGESTAEFRFTPEEGQTRVTWSMHGKNSFMGKAIGLIMNCEKMVGEQFEKGLGNLKALAEANNHTAS